MRLIARFILYTLFGWKAVGSYPRNIKKFVLIAAPHTHWQDFPLAMLYKFAESMPANFIGKASLFKPPFGFIFKWLGGEPVDRSKSTNLVQTIVDVYNNKENFILGISPEGTREKVDKWKTGFYFIAKGANVPIVMATLDFKNKEIKMSEPFYPTDNMEDDFEFMQNFYVGVLGKKPENY
ncbi:1-acyl-sn-glycerol-3-phosphate acyltransferase [Lutibacter sp.]|uniref:1-acyl-sn-glycerol-3-phosphate acyltransferase n=1 Tax=Lutibacter sp. TaxID=1925666 RepID=UPI0027366224|nr:1-acyl-sn-glycerol-3-phosphate acyltransferase [Lutibacter sp.]MDP3313232.1 acyltransferase [Lutibacter sp.]